MEYKEYIDILFDVDENTKLEFDDNDTLLVIDMQNDFLSNGYLSVREGDIVAEEINKLVSKILYSDNGNVVCSKDYHPYSHVSFSNNGGCFPSHCVMGTSGSYIDKNIAESLYNIKTNRKHEKAHIVFKGFDKYVDSYGAAIYCSRYRNRSSFTPFSHIHHCHSRSGAFNLDISAHNFEKDKDKSICDYINSPPDISFERKNIDRYRLENMECIKKSRNIFVVGLALDFCVIDSAINLSLQSEINMNQKIYVILELTRPVFDESTQKYITPNNELLKLKQKFNIQFISIKNLIFS